MELPVDYTKLTWQERKQVRLQYIQIQNNICIYCGSSLNDKPSESILSKKINWKIFPKGFLDHPIHLQHNHKTGMTEGAVHSYCNAVMWQYEHR